MINRFERWDDEQLTRSTSIVKDSCLFFIEREVLQDDLRGPVGHLDSILLVIVDSSIIIEVFLVGFTIIMVVVVVMTVTMMIVLLCVFSHISVGSVGFSTKSTSFYTVHYNNRSPRKSR